MKILDVCCGSKMFWYDKHEPHTTRYVLPSKKDIVKYLGDGAWAIKEEPSWMIG